MSHMRIINKQEPGGVFRVIYIFSAGIECSDILHRAPHVK